MLIAIQTNSANIFAHSILHEKYELELLFARLGIYSKISSNPLEEQIPIRRTADYEYRD